MAGINNNVPFGQGFRLEISTPADTVVMQKTGSISIVNFNSNPENGVFANTGSITLDRDSGIAYIKQSGTNDQNWSALVALNSAPTFTGNVSSLIAVYAPYDTGAGEGYYFSDGTPALREIGIARANYFFGNSGNSTMSGIANTGGGQASLTSLTSGNQNTGMGNGALAFLTSGGGNCAYGYFSMFSQSTGTLNSAFGWASLQGTGDFSHCTAFGAQALLNNSGDNNTAVGRLALTTNTTGTENTAIGISSLSGVTTGVRNVGVGSGAGAGITTGANNVAIGYLACRDTATSNHNIGIGFISLVNCTASNNVAIGYQALANIVAGTENTAIGYNAGSNLTATDSNNILIKNVGTAGDNGTIRIGTNATHTTCFLQGISGVTVTGAAVICATNGQLGTVVSSERYKENIEQIPKDVSILDLDVIKFNYKSDEMKSTQYGLLAEDVHEKMPYLCLYNEEKQPESVKYHELCTFLLHEVQKLNERVKLLESK